MATVSSGFGFDLASMHVGVSTMAYKNCYCDVYSPNLCEWRRMQTQSVATAGVRLRTFYVELWRVYVFVQKVDRQCDVQGC